MTRLKEKISSFLCELYSLVANRMTLSVWAISSFLATIVGPFGTYISFGIVERGIYWTAVSAVSILLAYSARTILGGRGAWKNPWLFEFSASFLFASVFTPVLWAMTQALHGSTEGMPAAWFLIFVIVSVYMMVILLRHFFGYDRPDDAEPRLMRRLPDFSGSTVMRLMVEDHYVRVFFGDGQEARLLMRLQDAVDEMQGVEGQLVHRSHWVRNDMISNVQRRKGRDFLELPCGTEVPVGRTFRPKLEEAGLI